MLIDSHAHLDSSEYDNDRDKVIQDAFDSGVQCIINVATDIKSIKSSQELSEKYDFIYFSAGIHPHYAEKIDFIEFQNLVFNAKLKAIGEIGLDFYRNISSKEKQIEIFTLSLKEAKKRDLPVIIHQRQAQKEILEVLEKEEKPESGVMHCFSGDLEWANKCLEFGYYISFAGNVTYPKAQELRHVAKNIPLDRLLIETDCPWLAPQPVRGKRCEPKHLIYTASAVAETRGISVEELERVVEENFKTLFKI